MTREELVDIRKKHFQLIEVLRRLGDHSAEAPHIRNLAETTLQMLDHMLEHAK